MTTQAPDRIWSGIDISKTLAGALAAVCAAVLGSFLGVAGTLVGAAVASIVGTVGTEIYARYLNRGAKKLQTLAPTFVKAPAAVGTPPVEAATEEESPSHTVPVEDGSKIRWGRIALIAGAVFVLAMGTIAVVELFAKQSVASMVGNSSSGSSTIGSVLNGGGGADEAPAPTTSTTPTDEATTPDDGAETTEPAEAPTTGTTTGPTAEPTTETPTTDAPQQTPPPVEPQQDPGAGAPGAEEE
jgi:cytoskeletal protein RodZ